MIEMNNHRRIWSCANLNYLFLWVRPSQNNANFVCNTLETAKIRVCKIWLYSMSSSTNRHFENRLGESPGDEVASRKALFASPKRFPPKNPKRAWCPKLYGIYYMWGTSYMRIPEELSIKPCQPKGIGGCFPLCQRFRKFRSEFKWKDPFRFLLTGIFGITSGGGPHISVGIFRLKFAVPFLTSQFFALIREFGERI